MTSRRDTSAPAIWEQANERLQSDELTPRDLCKVRGSCVCTTDDPTDDLAHHRAIAESDLPTKVYPDFPPDAALRIDEPAEFNAWIEKLASIAEVEIQRSTTC